MTNEDAIATAESEQRIDRATDAIRGMSQDLAEEVAPHPTWLDQVSAVTRAAPISSLAIAFLIGVILARR
jgi:cell division protein FtsX